MAPPPDPAQYHNVACADGDPTRWHGQTDRDSRPRDSRSSQAPPDDCHTVHLIKQVPETPCNAAAARCANEPAVAQLVSVTAQGVSLVDKWQDRLSRAWRDTVTDVEVDDDPPDPPPHNCVIAEGRKRRTGTPLSRPPLRPSPPPTPPVRPFAANIPCLTPSHGGAEPFPRHYTHCACERCVRCEHAICGVDRAAIMHSSDHVPGVVVVTKGSHAFRCGSVIRRNSVMEPEAYVQVYLERSIHHAKLLQCPRMSSRKRCHFHATQYEHIGEVRVHSHSGWWIPYNILIVKPMDTVGL